MNKVPFTFRVSVVQAFWGFFFCLFCGIPVFSQTHFGGGGSIPTNGTPGTFNLNVTGLTPLTTGPNFGLETVCINVTHPWISDLEVQLRAPDGTVTTLSDRNGSFGDNYTNTCFNQNASQAISTGSAPFTGTWRPDGNLSLFNNGQNPNGNWQLLIEDHFPWASDGSLVDWSLTFGNNPAVPFAFDSSYLPIVVIETNGQTIVDEPDIMAEMGIIYNGPGQVNYVTDPHNDYDGHCGIEIRGRSSQSFAKKSYGVETWDSLGNDIDVSLLGLPTEEDWILHGPYTDKTLMRNVLIMQMARETGQYASRTRHVELLLNGEYRGVYVLMEKIKRDGDRVDIAKLDSSDIAGDDLTGGYIFQINNNSADGWNSNYDVVTSPGDKLQFSYVYPKHSVILPVQEQYIQAYVDSFEQALIAPSYMNTAGKRYDEYIDLESFAEHFILSEVGKNVDAYRLSSYVWKKKDSKGGKLHAGPMWDFNLAFFNADYCDAWESFGWMYDEHCDDYNPFWWGRLRADPVFMNVVYCRWNDMRATVLDTANLYGIIDSVVTHLGDAADRNFEQWPVLGTYLWPNPATPATYAGEIQNLKDWLADRLAWLDANITGSCMVSVDDGVAVEHVELTVWPNPGREAVRLDVSSGWAGRAQLRVVDLRGQIVLQEEIGVEAGRMSLPLEVEALAPGVYAIVLEGGFGRKTVKWVKI